jgi:hypothetical protein
MYVCMSAHTNITATENALSKQLLKGILLQHLIRSFHTKVSRCNMDRLVTQIQYDKYSWHVYRDFRVIVLRLTLQLDYVRFYCKWDTTALKSNYSSAPVSTGNTFQDLQRLCETADNTERYI